MKVLNGILSVFLLGIICYSCKNNGTNDCPDRELRTISFDFESDLEDWIVLGGKGELKDLANLSLSSETAYSGNNSAKFIITQDSYINGGVRAELTFDQYIEAGDNTYYEYSILIPKDYKDVSSLKAENGNSNWQILGQWHDQPDTCIGQTWDDLGNNPPYIALYYNYLSTSDTEYKNLLENPKTKTIYGFDANWDNVSTVSLVYGGETIAIAKINKGEWVTLKYNIKWSTKNDGYIQAWINNNAFTNGKVTGSNMLNNASHYFKFGIYRNPTIPFTNTIYYDKVSIYY